MRRLLTEQDVADLTARIRTLRPETRGQWGRMSCPQMVCHLSDAFRGPLGERAPAAARGNVLTHTLVKWVIIRTPMPWPHGVATTPEIDQAAGRGTPPAQFVEDIDRLIEIMR